MCSKVLAENEIKLHAVQSGALSAGRVGTSQCYTVHFEMRL